MVDAVRRVEKDLMNASCCEEPLRSNRSRTFLFRDRVCTEVDQDAARNKFEKRTVTTWQSMQENHSPFISCGRPLLHMEHRDEGGDASLCPSVIADSL